MPGQNVHLHFRMFPEGNLWVGECIELGVSTSAETEDEARRGIDEATTLYLATLADQSELQRVLEEHGVPIVPEGTPSVGRIEERTLAVPAGAA